MTTYEHRLRLEAEWREFLARLERGVVVEFDYPEGAE